MSKMGKIRVPPKLTLGVLQQRLVLSWFIFTFTGVVWSWIATLYLALSSYIAVALIACYLAYIWGPGKKVAESVSWEPRLQRMGMWRMFAEYFDARLIKTADLDPSGNYLFAMVPHGIGSISAWVNFCTEATGFRELFPGINVRALTLEHNFCAPLIREYALLHGLRSVSKKSISNILTSGPGSSVLLVPGGASESLLAAPGTMDLVTNRRKGFVRMALTTGAALVPVVAFGENEVYQTFVATPGSKADAILSFIKKVCGFAVPIFWGFGLLGGSGLIPYNQPLNTVIGKPIHLPKYVPGMTFEEAVGTESESDSDSTSASSVVDMKYSRRCQPGDSPHSTSSACSQAGKSVHHTSSADSHQGDYGNKRATQGLDPVFDALVDKYHSEFMAATQALYEAHKDKYAADRIRDLNFI